MKQQFHPRLRQVLTGFMSLVVFFGFAAGSLLLPGTPAAKAQCINSIGLCNTVDPSPGIRVFVTNESLAAKLKNRIDYQLTFALYIGALNAATYFAQTIAYDFAEYTATGFKGQNPGFFNEKMGDYIVGLTADSFADFLGSFSENFTEGAFGINLCSPPRLPELALDFALQIPDLNIPGLQRPRPLCRWSIVAENWKESYKSLSNAESIKNVKGHFSQGGNDVAFGLGANLALFDYVSKKRTEGLLDRQEGRGFKSVEDFISGNIETPAAIFERNVEFAAIDNAYNQQNMTTAALMSNAFEIGWIQLAVVTASTFTNVLLTRLISRVTEGLFPSTGGRRGLPDFLNPGAAPGSSTAPKEIFAEQYRDIITPRITVAEQQDLVGELLGCPTDGRTKWHCTIDDSFATALRQGGGLTVRQALDLGFLNEDWELIPSSQLRDNQDPSCRTRAFCVANLRKLRLARILPIGWEIAADSVANQIGCARSNRCITLGEVIRKFDDCTDEGTLDADHPWCHLIDPNWVLTAFPAQCITRGFSQSLLSNTGQRLEECQDTVTCLERDENGQCIGDYGYCMAEQTFWQFEAQKCSEQYVSCRTYTPRGQNAKEISYLRTTLDYGSCSEENVGCMWYANSYDSSNPDGAWDASYAGLKNKIYFDRAVLPCDASNAGCTDLRRVELGEPALNLVKNGSFETLQADADLLEGWDHPGNWIFEPADPTEGNDSYVGANGLLPPVRARGVLTQTISGVRPNRQYTLSFYARRSAGTAPSDAGALIRFLRERSDADQTAPPRDNAEPLPASSVGNLFVSEGCIVGEPTYGAFPGTGAYAVRINAVSEITQNSDEWDRFECSFITPGDTYLAELVVLSGDGATNRVILDAVQLEESEQARPFVDSLNPILQAVTMKVAPEELGCTGDEDTDHPLCAGYARVCRQDEAGCQGYRPVMLSSASEIPAVLTDNDLCPSECVGYAELRKQASTFDLIRSVNPQRDDPDDDTIAHFIPSTGRVCSAQHVGCEAFTNLDITSGPSEFGFNYLRSCERPGIESATFYTWEGSEESGFQLRTWSLILDTSTALPHGPKVIFKAGPDGRFKDPARCTAEAYVGAVDPDCRQFYDTSGDVFYRYESQTVISSPQCARIRKDGSTRADCEKTGGQFDSATNQCIYNALTEESRSCDIAFAGCRAYIGTQGNVAEQAFEEEFIDADHTAVALGSASFALSPESVLVGDQSLRIETSGKPNGVSFEVPTEPGVLYELTFWTKSTGAGTTDITLRTSTDLDAPVIGTASLRPNWTVSRIGPFTGAAATSVTPVVLRGFPALTFIDKIRIERVQDTAYVIKNSWNTPDICDRSPEGVPQLQAMLGCRAYVDRNNTEVNVRQFTRLCRNTSIGCNAYVNTKNSQSVYEQTFERDQNLPGVTDGKYYTTAPADHYAYYIESQSMMCNASEIGCKAVGLPQFDQDRLALKGDEAFHTVYLYDRVSDYEEGLCSEPELFCEEYQYDAAGTAGVSYFHAPSDHACEYRESVVVDQACSGGIPTDGITFDGWFKIGTACPCYEGQLKQGSEFGVLFTGDVGFNAWTGADASLYADGGGVDAWTATCPEAAAECTELRDVNDKSDLLRPLGRPYYIVNDDRLDKETCAGQVDPSNGCVLFRDMSETQETYSTVASYAHYKDRGYQSVDGIDCKLQPNHPACLRTVCLDLAPQGADANLSANVNAANYLNGRNACTDHSDCSFPCPNGSCTIQGPCRTPDNDTNIVVKVNPDRRCSQWLACETGETVFDPQLGRYRSICSELALCNRTDVPEGAGVPFCSSFVNRSENAVETILKENTVLNAETYSSRYVGFGTVDYAGSSLPDQFQIMDTELVPVGSFLTTRPATQSQFKKDYRLAAVVRMGQGARVPTQDEYNQFASSDAYKPYLCIFEQTGAYGLRTTEDFQMDVFGDLTLDDHTLCWLSVDQSKPPQALPGAEIFADNLNTANLATRFEQGAVTGLDQVLNQSFPNTQCKAAPETDSPFPNDFVIEWDDTTDPPLPKRVVPGYSNAAFCEYGEDCSCIYKRVNYGDGQSSKYYHPLSTNVVNAICVGGFRDGLPCVANQLIAGSQPGLQGVGSNSPESGADAPGTGSQLQIPQENPNDGCGDAGVCSPISSVDLVRGLPGQCLQYDVSRIMAGDATRNECLVWSPTPVFAGPGDPYHWSPEAGFQPPQSSGRYYCTSPVREPRTFRVQPHAAYPKDEDPSLFAAWAQIIFSGLTGPFAPLTYLTWQASEKLGSTVVKTIDNVEMFIQPQRVIYLNGSGKWYGNVSQLFYHDKFASDGSGGFALDPGFGKDGGADGAQIDRRNAKGTEQGEICEGIDDNGQPDVRYPQAMRLISTGQGTGHSYAEYAIHAHPGDIARGILGFAPTDETVIEDFSTEESIANFSFSVPREKIGCAYSAGWADAPHFDYNGGRDKWTPADQAWHSNFTRILQEGGGVLDRRNSKVLTEDGSRTGTPIPVECAFSSMHAGEDTGTCFLKTWELGYRAEGQTKFVGLGLEVGRAGLDQLSRSPVYGKCDSSKPWFAIRAVFENTSREQNNLFPDEVNPDQLSGPWQFVGFWITACHPGNQTRYIYMNMNVHSADICRELAETISKDSHDVVAFTDRNSANSGFSMNRNGFSWNTSNIPFGASLATGDAGEDPLYMTGVSQSEVNPLNPPTFTSPGVTYWRPEQYPTNNWGSLSNIFAKIYRIYAYFPQAVGADDWACTSPNSPNFGGWCPRLGESPISQSEQDRLAREFCGLAGTCFPTGADSSDVFGLKLCNSFSGVNRGLDCTNDPDICHRAAHEANLDGVLEPQYASCELYNTNSDDDVWEVLPGGRYRCTNKSTEELRARVCLPGVVDCGSQGLQPEEFQRLMLLHTSDCPAECEGLRAARECTRALAIKHGAFRCGSDSVRSPNRVFDRVSIVTSRVSRTYASYCTKEDERSTECPAFVGGGGLCGEDHRCIGHPWAQCIDDTDCEFSARNFWPTGSVNDSFAWISMRVRGNPSYNFSDYSPIGQYDGSKIRAKPDRPLQYYAVAPRGFGDQVGLPADDALHDKIKSEMFAPATPAFQTNGATTDRFFTMFIAPNLVSDFEAKSAIKDETVTSLGFWDDSQKLYLYPGFNPLIFHQIDDDGKLNNELLHCSFNFNPASRYVPTKETLCPGGTPGNALNWWPLNQPPYVDVSENKTEVEIERGKMVAHYAACESASLMYRQLDTNDDGDPVEFGEPGFAHDDGYQDDTSIFGATAAGGICRGGARAGQVCKTTEDCKPQGLPVTGPNSYETLQANAAQWCNPVINAPTCYSGGRDANSPRDPVNEPDSQFDTNICTHPAGYWPRPNYCTDPTDEYCGLFGYDLGDLDNSVSDDAPLPTDVTPGLYTPLFLNADGPGVEGDAIHYSYLNYYNPIPPQVAAPDVRSCQGGSCRAAGLGTFSINGLSSGVVNGGSGYHIATLQFYAWAAHNQMPLRRVMIDWGDGTQTELPDAYMKNHKPVCQTDKECSLMPGLTCGTDADCPPGGGACKRYGSCSTNPSRRCSSDTECSSGGEPGFCQFRTEFGNDGDACEEQYFEFRHAYSCLPGNEPDESCGFADRCSVDPDIVAGEGGCIVPGTFQSDFAPQEGCFETSSKTCRFTPRILVIDNWGWCSGECRSERNSSGILIDRANSRTLHPNGGCFDASGIKSNVDQDNSDSQVGPNECNPLWQTLNKPAIDAFTGEPRPWTIFPGSLQMLSGEQL